MRGAITNGKLWLFFTYRQLDVGGSYALSEVVELGKQAEGLPLILGLLRDWVRVLLACLCNIRIDDGAT